MVGVRYRYIGTTGHQQLCCSRVPTRRNETHEKKRTKQNKTRLQREQHPACPCGHQRPDEYLRLSRHNFFNTHSCLYMPSGQWLNRLSESIYWMDQKTTDRQTQRRKLMPVHALDRIYHLSGSIYWMDQQTTARQEGVSISYARCVCLTSAAALATPFFFVEYLREEYSPAGTPSSAARAPLARSLSLPTSSSAPACCRGSWGCSEKGKTQRASSTTMLRMCSWEVSQAWSEKSGLFVHFAVGYRFA